MLHLQSQVLFVPAQDLENTGEPDETAGHCRDQSATAASGDTRSAELEPCYRTATPTPSRSRFGYDRTLPNRDREGVGAGN